MCLIIIKEASISIAAFSVKITLLAKRRTRSQMAILLLDGKHASRRVYIFRFSRCFKVVVRDQISTRVCALEVTVGAYI